MAELWVYGDTTSKVTDGHMQEYVSKYLTQHSNFPVTIFQCLTSFHKGVFTPSYWVQRTEMRLENYSRLETSKHLQQIMLLTKKVFDALFPCPMRITLNCPLDLQALPFLMLQKLLPFFVRWYTLPAVSSLPKAKSMMTGM